MPEQTLFPSNQLPTVSTFLHGFRPQDLVVRTFENHPNDNRVYVVQDQYGTYYTGRTNVQSLHGETSFMIDTTNLRPVTKEERDAHCRIVADSDLEVVVIWGG